MSRRLDWERAKQTERAKPEYVPKPIRVPSSAGRPATPAQLAYLHHLDPSISEENLRALDCYGASASIKRLLREKSS
ncbi:MAG: hypothetical protein ACYC33_10455 [Thermoleophilia bacterium]